MTTVLSTSSNAFSDSSNSYASAALLGIQQQHSSMTGQLQHQHEQQQQQPLRHHEHDSYHPQHRREAQPAIGAELSSSSSSSPHRPTSAPPDLELSSAAAGSSSSSNSVFAYGLTNFHQHFRHDSDRSRLSVEASQLSSAIRQPVVDDAAGNGSLHSSSSMWSSAISPTRQSSAGAITSSGGGYGLRAQQQQQQQQQQQHHQHQQQQQQDSGSADLSSQLHQAMEALSVQDGSKQAEGAPSASLSDSQSASSYLYSLGLQQSLLGSVNIASLTPSQLSLLQQQMQRLSSPPPAASSPPVSEQQKQLQLLILQQQLQQQQQQQQAAAAAMQLFHQQQQLAGQGGLYAGRGGYGGHRAPRRDDRGMQGGGAGAERAGYGRKGRDEYRGGGGGGGGGGYGGERYYQQMPQQQQRGVHKYGKQQQQQQQQYRFGGGAYGAELPVHSNGGEGKLLSPSRPLSPANSSLYHGGSSSDADALDDSYSSSSSLVAQFTSASSLEELQGSIYRIAKDQYGCRLLQRLLDDERTGLVDLVFLECFEHVNELMTDAFGNYLMQKLIEHAHERQRIAIIGKAADDLVPIALNMHGTRAVQKIVETVSSPAEVELVVAALRQSVVTLIKDLNGNHVIQRCLHHLCSADNQFIYDAVSRHCVSVATHKHGCCVLQRCIDYASPQQRRQLVTEVVSNALELVQDAFGNYVAQYVLDLGDAAVCSSLISALLGHVSSLSVQKFSSNVVEKCLELGNDKLRAAMIEELTNAERLPRLLQDPYANYVLQKALTVSKKAQFERLVAAIKPHLATLRNTSFGKRIQSKICKKFPHLGIALDMDADDGSSSGSMQAGHAALYDTGVMMMAQQQQQQSMMQQQQQQQQQRRQPQSHAAGLGIGALRATNGFSLNSGSSSALQQSLMQQQLALQQLSLSQPQQQQSAASPFGSLPALRGELSELSELQHSLHQQQPQQHYAVNGHPLSHPSSSASSSSLLTGMPQLLHAYPPSSLSPHNASGLDTQLHSNHSSPSSSSSFLSSASRSSLQH